MIATYRDDELGRSHPLRLVLGELATAAAVDPDSGRAALARGRRPARGGLPDRRRRAASSRPAATRSSSPRSSPPEERRIPATVRDVVLARVAQPERAPRRSWSRRPLSRRRVADALADRRGLRRGSGRSRRVPGVGSPHAADGAIAFRHELARAAVEESLSPTRRLALHRAVLLALADWAKARATSRAWRTTRRRSRRRGGSPLRAGGRAAGDPCRGVPGSGRAVRACPSVRGGVRTASGPSCSKAARARATWPTTRSRRST